MLILASSSPRRRTLLQKITSSFIVIVPRIDERLLDSALLPHDLPKEESRLKAYAIYATHPHDAVIACDTIVILNHEILGKPKNETDAVHMLQGESGKKQFVLSSYTYLDSHREISRSVATAVYFKQLSDDEIVSYVKKYRPLDKAGSYGIQDEAGLIDHIEGSYSNVMGLPIEDIMRHHVIG